MCGSELTAERRKPGRRFEKLVPDRGDAAKPGPAAGLGQSATS